jgi:glucuronosyltransferase
LISFQKILTLFALCSLIIQNVGAAKILGVFPFPGKSHSVMLLPLMKELANKGHEVTVITNFRLNEKIANYTEILIEPMFDFWKNGIPDFHLPQITLDL